MNDFIYIYPNPVQDKLHFKNIEENEKISIIIENLIGVPVKEVEVTNSEIDVADLLPSIYLIKIKNKVGVSIGKFLKE